MGSFLTLFIIGECIDFVEHGVRLAITLKTEQSLPRRGLMCLHTFGRVLACELIFADEILIAGRVLLPLLFFTP